jgi:ubiquinone/menaquinone biosynthesis C-methylase UbiE
MDESKHVVMVYDVIVDQYASTFTEPSEYIDELLSNIDKGGLILDVGCGTGVDANYISSKGYQVIGIDFSDKMLKLAKQKFPDIDFRIADMRELKFGENMFDGILLAYSLIHIPKRDVPKTLSNLYKFMKSGSPILVIVHGGKSQETNLPEPFKPNMKMFLDIFSPDELKKLLKEAGFSVISEHQRKSKSEKGEFDFFKLFLLAKK